MLGTLLAQARGCNNQVISQKKRRDQMQPISPEVICNTNRERTLYLLEIATFKLSNRLMDESIQCINEALAIELRRWFISEYRKFGSTIFDSDRLIQKLRSRVIIDKHQFKALRRINSLTDQCQPSTIEKAIETIAQLADPQRYKINH